MTAKSYITAIRAYERTYANWVARAEAASKSYRDEVEGSESKLSRSSFNVFWSNVQTLQPALYARTPKPECERRWRDRDPVGRIAAEIQERVSAFQVSQVDFDTTMKAARDDYLIPGRGQVWVRYVPTFGQALGPDETGQIVPELVDEKVEVIYIHWKDFGHDVQRSWADVTKVWRKTYMTKAEVSERFGPEKAELLKFEAVAEYLKQDKDELDKTAQKVCIYEVWCKQSKSVHWICLDYKEDFLDSKQDLYNLRGFFPCPRPIYASLTNDSLIPIIDFSRYQALAAELDELVGRRRALLKAIKVVGTYDASQEELSAIFTSGKDLSLLPSRNWAQLQTAGGLRGVIDLIPIDQYIKALGEINAAIGEVKNAIYELTGISDIIRGYSDPNATATAEQIKGNFATLRLEDRQREIQRFARDVIALMSELAVERFSPQTLAEMSNIVDMTPEAQQIFPQAVQLLKDDKQRTYRVTIETDSTIAIDEDAEKQKRTEALTAFGQFIERAVPQMMNMPELAPVMQEMLLFGARSFSTGRPMEFALERALEAINQRLQAQAQQGPSPDPEMMKAQSQMKVKEAELNIKAQESQVDAQIAERKMQMDIELQRQKLDAELKLEELRINNELALKQFEIMQRLQFDAAVKQQEAERAAVEAPAQQAAQESNSTPTHLNINVSSGNKRIVFGTDQNGQRVAEVIESGQ